MKNIIIRSLSVILLFIFLLMLIGMPTGSSFIYDILLIAGMYGCYKVIMHVTPITDDDNI